LNQKTGSQKWLPVFIDMPGSGLNPNNFYIWEKLMDSAFNPSFQGGLRQWAANAGAA
jgi:hypothetical protein